MTFPKGRTFPEKTRLWRRAARVALLLLCSFTLLAACTWFRQEDEPIPTALVIGYRRMFNHDRTEHTNTPFTEAVQKAGSVTAARLDAAEDTGEGYAIYTFTVLESLFNPDDDKVIHLYESIPAGDPATDSSAPPFTPAYRSGLTYLLVLSRATDVYYPHPYFHNFNGIFIAADESGNVVQAVSADGEENLARDRDTRKAFRTFAEATAHVKALLAEQTPFRKGTWRFNGMEVLSDDPATLASQSPYIAQVRTGETVFQNRYVQEVQCTITKPYKGIFGLGSGPEPDNGGTPPATAILPGSRRITVLFPANLDVSPGREWLLFLREEEEYRLTAKAGAISVADEENYARWLAAIEEEMNIPATPEPTPEPAPELTPRVWTLLDAYKDLPARNPDVRGWVRQEGTVIDYPVLQAGDNDWYLSRDIDRKKTVSGSIVLDFRVDIKNLGRNTPLYGHNMKRGTMFHSLVNYKTERYFREHPTIRFDTLYDELEWEIVAVYVVDSSYNYVITMDFKDDIEYRAFLDDIEARSMYPLREPLSLEDQILTMVTCSYEFDGARTIVQAKLVRPRTGQTLPSGTQVPPAPTGSAAFSGTP